MGILDRGALALAGLAGLAAPLLVANGSGAAAAPVPTPRGSLCAVGEQVIFHCSIGRRMVSVCGGRATAPLAQYRFGTPGDIELAYPGPGQSALTFAREAYSGGGALQIRFSNGGYDYAVYERTVRTGFGADGRHFPRFSDGVMVRRGRRLVANLACTTAPYSTAGPEEFMPEGTMMRWFDDG